MYRIGLTGGVGCGKSTVSSYLKELGIPIIDGDLLAREAVTPGSDAMKKIKETFGEGVFTADGALDRRKVADLVFSDEEQRQKLNAIIHPFIWRRTQEELAKAEAAGAKAVVLDMPLLLEIGWHLRVEGVWVVYVPQEVQIARVMGRDGFTREQVLDRIGKQMSTENKLKYADVVIDNSGTVEETRAQVDRALGNLGIGGQ